MGMGKMGDGYGHTSKHRRVKRLLFCEKPSCASILSHLTHLMKLAPHFTHIEPSPFPIPLFCLPIQETVGVARVLCTGDPELITLRTPNTTNPVIVMTYDMI